MHHHLEINGAEDNNVKSPSKSQSTRLPLYRLVVSGLFKPQMRTSASPRPCVNACSGDRQTTAELVFVDPSHRKTFSNPR